MQLYPGFELAGLRVGQPRIVGDHRPRRLGGRRHQDEQGNDEKAHGGAKGEVGVGRVF